MCQHPVSGMALRQSRRSQMGYRKAKSNFLHTCAKYVVAQYNQNNRFGSRTSAEAEKQESAPRGIAFWPTVYVPLRWLLNIPCTSRVANCSTKL
ncbi:MAG: hypothetical protein GY820_28225 [Gammaproteobacteria bacterium]|nr:hypothetical protein [Gammaproteobacteria bacterium]